MNKGRKLTFPLKYEHFALVVTSAAFPIDAFRYDKCFPYSEADSREIADSIPWIKGEDAKTRVIVVRKHSTDAAANWTIPFWKSHTQLSFVPISPEEADEINRRRNDNAFDMGWIENEFLFRAKFAR